MPRGNPRCSDAEFISLFNQGGARAVKEATGILERNVYARRRSLEAKYGASIFAPSSEHIASQYPDENKLEVKNGLGIVGSDFHILPGSESVSLRAFKKLCKELKPSFCILNGDVLDFPKISRHPPIGWEKAPNPNEEIEAAQDHLNDIEMALPRGCAKIWTLGNHDARFETRLATVASEYRNIKGIHLSDHFPHWKKGWKAQINADVIVKHRFKGGVHATYNNTLHAGMTMVTGHLHSQKVTPFTDYRGTRYGIDTGCVADPEAQPFRDYTEENPKNWISGFAVLKFKDGRLMYPELASRWDDKHVQFRGDLIRV